MAIFDFDNYKEYFNDWVTHQPKSGHGEFRRAAQALRVSTTMISQVFRGSKQLSLEMASDLCDHIGLNEDESDYFVLLVELQKAGSYKLQQRLKRQVKARQERARKVEGRVKRDFELSDEEKAVFYSSWIYSGVRLLTAVPEFNSVSAVAEKLHLPRNQVQKIVDFLKRCHLVEEKSGELNVGKGNTFIGANHLLVSRHHQNWRLQSFQKMIQSDDKNLFYTHPVALSFEAVDELRKLILNFISEANKIAGPSESETVRCLNIDFFEY